MVVENSPRYTFLMDYPSIKLIHISAVTLSGLGFAARGLGSFLGAQWTRSRPAKILPQVVDTVLLLSALTLAGLAHLNPAHTPWLLAKIIGLVVYIGLGVVALRPGVALRTRVVAWVLALVVLVWIASAAVLKTPWGFFGI